jgi:hypothetical protein
MLAAMKEATKLKVATAVTVLFLGAISAAGLANRSGDDRAPVEPAAAQAGQTAAPAAVTDTAAVVLPAPSGYEADDDAGYADDQGYEDEGFEED